MGVGRGAGVLDFEIISKKGLFFRFRGVKNKLQHFFHTLETILGKPHTAPHWKNPSDAYAGNILNTDALCENLPRAIDVPTGQFRVASTILHFFKPKAEVCI